MRHNITHIKHITKYIKASVVLKDTITLRASITLEASIIYPLVIFISMLIILYSFSIHDKLVISADTYRILIENNHNNTKNKSTNFSFSESEIIERLNKKCILTHTFSISFDKKNSTFKLMDDNNHIKNISFSNYERCDFIRKYYTILTQLKKSDTNPDK